MERPKKYFAHELHPGTPVFKFGSINPLLHELEQLKADKKPFPSLDEFKEWWINVLIDKNTSNWEYIIHEYFAQFQYERTVFPKVGEEYEFRSDYVNTWFKGELVRFSVRTDKYGVTGETEIRPVTRPTREEVIKSINNKLENNTDKIIFDRELVEQFLKILKG